MKAVTAPWHGGAWADPGADMAGGGAASDGYPTPPGSAGSAPSWSSDAGGGARVGQMDGLSQAWQAGGH